MQNVDVAISVAGEDRDKAEQLVSCFKELDVKVFYDKDYQAELAGVDLYQRLHIIFRDNPLFFLPLISVNYIKNEWTLHELRAAQEREFKETIKQTEYIIPIKLDDTDAPGIPTTKSYLDMRKLSPSKIASIIKQKLEIRKNSNISVNEDAKERYSSIEGNEPLTGIDKADELLKEANEQIGQQKYNNALQSLLDAWIIYSNETGAESSDTNKTLEKMKTIYTQLNKTQPFDQWLHSAKQGM